MNAAIDVSGMYTAHDALRREMDLLVKKALTLHHMAEDEALWPVMRAALADRPDDLLLLDVMEAEHEAIDPLLAAVDAALADRDEGPGWLGDIVDALTAEVRGHLRHEEAETLPLIQAFVTVPQWQVYGQTNARLMGAEAARLLPWMLSGADDEVVAATLGQLPEALRAAYRDEWQPAYAALDVWGGRV